MTRTFLPEAHYLPVPEGYKPTYRLFRESRWRLVPGVPAEATIGRALSVAKDYMARQLNPPIRSEQAVETRDVLGREEWLMARSARAAEEQETLLDAIVGKGGRLIKVERRGIKT